MKGTCVTHPLLLSSGMSDSNFPDGEQKIASEMVLLKILQFGLEKEVVLVKRWALQMLFNTIIQQLRLLNGSYTMLSMVCWAWWQQLGRRLRCCWHRYLLRTNYRSRPVRRLIDTSAKQLGSQQENIIILFVMKVVTESWWMNTYGELQKYSSARRMRFRDTLS